MPRPNVNASYLAALPEEAGFPVDMKVDEDEKVLYVACEHGVWAIDFTPGPRVLRSFYEVSDEDNPFPARRSDHGGAGVRA